MSINQDDARLILKSLMADERAKIQASQANAMSEVQNYDIDLTVERTKENALKISFPFKTVYMQEATDDETHIWLIPEDNERSRGSVKIEPNDVYSSEYGFKNCFVYWRAQAGKKCQLTFLTTSTIDKGSLYTKSSSSIEENVNINIDTSSIEYKENVLLGESSFCVNHNEENADKKSPYRGEIFLNKYPEYLIDVEIDLGLKGLFNQKAFKVPSGYQLRLLSFDAKNLVYARNYFSDIYNTTTGSFAGIVKDDRKIISGSDKGTFSKNLSLPCLYALNEKTSYQEIDFVKDNQVLSCDDDYLNFKLDTYLHDYEIDKGDFKFLEYTQKDIITGNQVSQSIIPSGKVLFSRGNAMILSKVVIAGETLSLDNGQYSHSLNSGAFTLTGGVFGLTERCGKLPHISLRYIAILEEI